MALDGDRLLSVPLSISSKNESKALGYFYAEIVGYNLLGVVEHSFPDKLETTETDKIMKHVSRNRTWLFAAYAFLV